MVRHTPRAKRTDPLCPYTTLFRAGGCQAVALSTRGASVTALGQRHPTVDRQFDAVDEAAVARSEEERGTRDLVGVAETAGRNHVSHPFDQTRQLVVGDPELGLDGGVDRARAQNVDAEAKRTEEQTS